MTSPLEQSQPATNMPPAVHEVFQLLHNDVCLLLANWRIFRQLYGTGEGRIHLLNRFAGVAFGLMQRAMYDGIILALGRITDPMRQAGRDNLCLEQLVAAVEAGGPEPLTIQVRQELTGLTAHCSEMRALWNRRVAHSDLEAARAVADDIDHLPGPSRQDIETALAWVRRLMNQVSLHYDDNEIGYHDVILPLGADGDALVRHFEDLARRQDKDGPRYGGVRSSTLSGE
jgi:hypothetical protein